MIHLSFTPNNYFVTITIMIKQFKMKYAQVVISDVNDSPPVLVEVSTNHLFLDALASLAFKLSVIHSLSN